MDKKELKFYEAPACDVVELKATSALLAGSGSTDPNTDVEQPEIPEED